MAEPEIEITCEPYVLFQRQARRPLKDRTDYTATGPDGKTYRNTNKAELTSLLRRRYGQNVRLIWTEIGK